MRAAPGLLLVVLLIPALSRAAPPAETPDPHRHFAPERRPAQARYEAALLEAAGSAPYAAWHQALSSVPHVAGTPGDRRVIESLAATMEAMGLEVEVQPVWLYLPRPVAAEVSIVTPEPRDLPVTEEVLPEDPYSAHPDLTFGWNAYSGSGTAVGQVVYANQGTKQDFERLAEMGVDVAGKVVVARYGGNFRGYKAKFAESYGAAALLMYLDPEDYGYGRGLMWPEGGWAHESSIQRGSILTLPYTGDPLTPFEPATKNATRLDPAEVDLPTIPVQPIGWQAARQILEKMTGAPVPEEWQGGLPFNYRLTGGPDLTVRVHVEQAREIIETANVTGTLRGAKHPDETIVVGCHHDAWSFGAGDPNAGSIVVLGVAEAFAQAAKQGHRPDRTLVFAHWAAEEFGILGSVEWVEARREELSRGGVAYVNLDMAAMGPNLRGSASPTVGPLIAEAAAVVPSVGDTDVTALDEWAAGTGTDPVAGLPRMGDLGGGSDHVAFYTHVGMPSLSLGAYGSSGTSYHTNYEDLAWYRQVVGSDYAPATMLTRVVSVLSARLAEADLLPLDPSRYGPGVSRHLGDLAELAKERGIELDVEPVADRAVAFERRAAAAYQALLGELDRGELTAEEAAEANRALLSYERLWIDEGGIPDRPWFRSLYASTDADSGYAAWMLPVLRHAIEAGDEAAAERALRRYGEVMGELEARIASLSSAAPHPPGPPLLASEERGEQEEDSDPLKPPLPGPAEGRPERGLGGEGQAGQGQQDDGKTIAQELQGTDPRPGLLDLHVDESKGKLWLTLEPQGPNSDLGTYLYVEGLVTGLGSNPVGLDRSQLGEGRLVTFRRAGGKVLLEEQNLRFRAETDDPLEAAAVRQSFATSVIWGGEIEAEDASGRVLVDFTPFLLRDAHEVRRRMKEAGQGDWQLDAGRSAVLPDQILAFPDNVELEALLTYTSPEPGPLVRQTAPVADTVTLVQHHSFLRLPDDGFTPRPFDPRAGYFGVGYLDYSVPLTAPLDKRWIARHRLTRGEPIVFYLDPGTPEPVRSALLEGASWWREAFAAAGFPDGYRVEMLPEGVHPLDARYHVIQWVHRSTRGWSYGGGVLDPRTGEIVKAYVLLGSLRVRQDRLLFEGLLGVDETGTGSPRDPVELSLARIRQLAAHEVGHALGLDHNFAASTYGDRASVMDYPAPWVRLGEGGQLDVSSVYGEGVGSWDEHAIRYGYAPLPAGRPEAALQEIVEEGLERGLLFIADPDARPAGSAHPLASLWDNGPDPVAELDRVMAVRETALSRFGEGNLAAGRPLSLLHEVLVPVYLYHRYQLEAAAKSIGGVAFTYAVRGDGQPPAAPVPAEAQRAALAAVLRALQPEALDLPEPVLALLLPRPPGHPVNRELFAGHTDPAFDPLAAAAAAADLVVDQLLEPHRAARLVDQHRRAPDLPSLVEVLDDLVAATFELGGEEEPERLAEIRRTVQAVVVSGLIELAGSKQASPAVRARVEGTLRSLSLHLSQTPVSGVERDHRLYLVREIESYFERPGPVFPGLPEPPEPPPGSPIGG